jgi:hypothetical protein
VHQVGFHYTDYQDGRSAKHKITLYSTQKDCKIARSCGQKRTEFPTLLLADDTNTAPEALFIRNMHQTSDNVRYSNIRLRSLQFVLITFNVRISITQGLLKFNII